MRLFTIITLLVGFASSSIADNLPAFLNEYCIRCHGPDKQKADRRFDSVGNAITSVDQAEHFQEILDQLNLGEMPPEDEDQPSPEQLSGIVKFLTSNLAKARANSQDSGGQVVLRRLNQDEYRNTVRDLFSLSVADFDPTTTFPKDDSVEGFDNVGSGLVTSDYLLQNYLEAARKVADKAIRPGPKPEMIHMRAEGNAIQGKGHGHRPEIARIFIKDRQPLGIPQLLKRRIREEGEYIIRIKARAWNRKSRYKDEDLRYNSSEPMRMSISIESKSIGKTSHRVIKEFEVPDEIPTEFEHRIWLEPNFAFQVHWANGPNGSTKRIMRKVLPKYTDDAIYPLRNPVEMYAGSGPELQVYSIEIEGPFYDEWPLPGFSKYFPSPPKKPNPAYLDASMKRLAQHAFRRPIDEDDLKPYLDLTKNYLAKNGDFWDAVKYGVRALLTSPNFIYHVENDGESHNLDAWELASRLSYFLWSSMPDDELFECAQNGSLLKPDVLLEQTERMLNDHRSESFVENFVGQWLQLRKLGEMPPDPANHKAYFEDNLEEAMKRETFLFFSDLLKTNGSILNFVDSEYTFLNPALAKHYGLSHQGDGFQKVSLPAESPRGGLLGHASVLTLTSNGVETQPVVRGVWILENLLGTPPSPPPPDIEPLEPDTRGVTTIRELMVKHRENATCYECHRKIDPLGLGMENFDHLGSWRDRYQKKSPIDPSGEMIDGTKFSGVDGIRKYLKTRPDQFTHCLTEKLMIYALGRRTGFTDRDDIDEIVKAMPKNNYGLRELIQQIVMSKPFQSK